MRNTRKGFISVILIMIMFISTLPIVAHGATSGTYGNLKYTANDDYITITGYNGSPSEIVIPSEIDGLPVTKIKDYAFRGCKSLVDIIIPESVINVGSEAFYDTAIYNNVDNWEEHNVLYIGGILIKAHQDISGEYIVKDGTYCIADSAFSGCRDLTNILLSDSLVSFGDAAFWMCKALKSIWIPKSVLKLGYWGFYGCDDFCEVYYAGTEKEWDTNLNSQGNGECWSKDNNVKIIFNATGTNPPTLASINTNSGKLDIELSDTEYDSKLITVFSNGSIYNNFNLTDIAAGDTLKQIDIPQNSKFVKVFIWDSLTGMKPLCEAQEITIE